MGVPAKHAALVADVERTTGAHVATVEEYRIAPPINGTCNGCGADIQFICVMLCDSCIDARLAA